MKQVLRVEEQPGIRQQRETGAQRQPEIRRPPRAVPGLEAFEPEHECGECRARVQVPAQRDEGHADGPLARSPRRQGEHGGEQSPGRDVRPGNEARNEKERDRRHDPGRLAGERQREQREREQREGEELQPERSAGRRAENIVEPGGGVPGMVGPLPGQRVRARDTGVEDQASDRHVPPGVAVAHRGEAERTGEQQRAGEGDRDLAHGSRVAARFSGCPIPCSGWKRRARGCASRFAPRPGSPVRRARGMDLPPGAPRLLRRGLRRRCCSRTISAHGWTFSSNAMVPCADCWWTRTRAGRFGGWFAPRIWKADRDRRSRRGSTGVRCWPRRTTSGPGRFP